MRKYNLIICGTRSFSDYTKLSTTLTHLLKKFDGTNGVKIVNICIGDAKGADAFARTFMSSNNIPFKEFKANWKLHGNDAGPIRNKEMMDYCVDTDTDNTIVLAFWDGQSSGTRNMINCAKKHNAIVKEVRFITDTQTSKQSALF